MSQPVRIKGSVQGGPQNEAAVTAEGALRTTSVTEVAINLPPEELTRRKLFYEFFRVGGVETGSRDMHLADGSTTPVDFVMKATSDRVRWISKLRFILEGDNFDLSASGDFRRWGSVATSPGLTNGFRLFAVQGGVETDIFLDPVQSMGDLFYYQDHYENFVNAVDAQADFLSVDIVMPQGVALPLGVEDKIVVRIQDDMVDAAFNTMRVIANGYQEVK